MSRSTAAIIFSGGCVVRTTSSAPDLIAWSRRSMLRPLMSASTGSPFSCLNSSVPSPSGRSRSIITQAGFRLASSKIRSASASDPAQTLLKPVRHSSKSARPSRNRWLGSTSNNRSITVPSCSSCVYDRLLSSLRPPHSPRGRRPKSVIVARHVHVPCFRQPDCFGEVRAVHQFPSRDRLPFPMLWH
jgi:hypothetical protein